MNIFSFFLFVSTLSLVSASYDTRKVVSTPLEDLPLPHDVRLACQNADDLPPDARYPKTDQAAQHCRQSILTNLTQTAKNLLRYKLLSMDITKYLAGLDKMASAVENTPQDTLHALALNMKLCIDSALCAILYAQVLAPHVTEDTLRDTMRYATVGQLSAVYVAARAYEKGTINSKKGLLLEEELKKYPLAQEQQKLWEAVQSGLRDEVKAKKKCETQLQWSVVWQLQGIWLHDWCNGAQAVAEASCTPEKFNAKQFVRNLEGPVYAHHHIQKNVLEDHAADWAKLCIQDPDFCFRELCLDTDPSKDAFRLAIDTCDQQNIMSIPTKVPPTRKPQPVFDHFCDLLKHFNPNPQQIKDFFESSYPEQEKSFLETYVHTPSASLFSYVTTHFVARHRFLNSMHETLVKKHVKFGATSQLCNATLIAETTQSQRYNQYAIQTVSRQSKSPAALAQLFKQQKTLEDLQGAQTCQLLLHALHTKHPDTEEVFHLCSREHAYHVLSVVRGTPHEERLTRLIKTTYPGWLETNPVCHPNLWLLHHAFAAAS